jgi:hypothetical protein
MIPLIRPERMNNTFRWLTQHIRREDRIRNLTSHESLNICVMIDGGKEA